MSTSLTWFKVQVIKQGGLYIAYSHTLDIATTGKSEAQALDIFTTIAEIFNRVASTKQKDFGLLDAELIKLGWKQKNKRWFPPEEK